MYDKETIVFVTFCTVCGAPISIIGADKEQNYFPQLSKEVTVSIRKTAKHDFLDSLNKEFQLFPFTKLPLCSICLSDCLREISIYTSLINRASKHLQQILTQIPVDIIQFNIEEFIKQNRIRPKLLSPRPIKYTFSEPQAKETSNHKKSLLDTDIVPFDASPRRQIQQNSLMCFTTFQIGFYQQYGTINGCPIGSFAYKPNSLVYTNAGLTILAHLVKHIIDCIILPDCNIEFTPEPHIMTRSGDFVLQIPEKTKNSKAVSLFNQANDSLFSLCHDIFAIGEVIGYDTYAPMFSIDTYEKKIDHVSYVYKPNDMEEWSLAIKFLLMNLKSEQLRSLRHCLGYKNR